MKVKKGSQQLRKGSRINRKRLRTLFFPYNFSVKPLRFPFGVQRLSLYTTRREAPSSHHKYSASTQNLRFEPSVRDLNQYF